MSDEPSVNVLNDFDGQDDVYGQDYGEGLPKEEGEDLHEDLLHKLDEPSGDGRVDNLGNETVLEDGIVDMPPPELQSEQPVPRPVPIVRRIIRRVRMLPDMGEGPSSSLQHGPTRKIYVRRKRTPEEELQLEPYEEEDAGMKRIPAPPGKRGRRPIMLPANHMEPNTRSDLARRTGRPIVVHASGVEFAIPSSLEAHPIQLSDTIPDNPAFDILKDDEGMPYCAQCHSVLRTFHALEYHVMSVHLKYRPFRCMFCVKEYFYTEDECIAHLKSIHVGKPIHIIRELKEDKEEQLTKFFQTMFLMIRETDDLSQQRVDGLQQAAYHQMQKYHRMRFRVPEVVARQRSQKDAAVQTFVSMGCPQTLVQMPMKPQYVSIRRDPVMANVKMVQLPSGEIVQHVVDNDNRYMVDREMEMAEHDAYDQIDVEDEELAHHVHY